MCILRNSDPCHLIPSRVLSEFYLFTNDALVSCLKNNIKIYIKTVPTCFGPYRCLYVEHTDTNMDLIYAATLPPY